MLFYSGHGLQVKGENYLIPVDAKIEMEMHLKRRAFSLSEILAVMGARTKTNIIFLDACRNNPFGSEPSRAIGLEGERALRRGLAQVEKAQGIFIAFAAAANEVALDGVGRNSRFTAALLKHIHTPGLSIADMMMDVSNTVAVETFDRQQPWQQSNLRAKFFFRPLEAASDKTADVEVAEQAQKERIETKKAVEHDQDIAQPDHARWASVLRAFKGWAPSATKVAGIAAAIGLLAYVAGGHLNFFVGFGIPVLLLIGFLIVLFLYIPQTYEISEYLILAEREMNSLLRAWGGGLSADARKAIAKERIDMAKAVGTPEALQQAFDLNISDLYGGPRAAAMGRARFTAFLLREIYEGNVRNAQRKIFNEVANGNNPYIAPGVRQIVGYDRFDKHDIKNNGFPPDAGVDWFPLWLTVKLNRYPRNIVMIRSDKSRVYNWDVIEELTGS